MMAVSKIAEGLIEQFELEHLVGQDAFADKYLAYDPETNRHVLISVLSEHFADDENYRKQYAKRCRALSRIRHPNIAAIYGFGETLAKQPFVASEQFEGFPLDDRLRRLAKQQSPAHVIYALTLVRQIASGLSLAERLGYFHYELTPRHIFLRNVTLKADDSAVLVNLDIPPQFALSGTLGDEGYNKSYLSPEQMNHKEIDGRSHVYSLGTVLFQLLTGKLPENGNANWQRRFRTTGSAGSTLKKLRDDLSPETYALVSKSMRNRPAGRHGSVSEFASALDQALAAEDLRIHTSALAEPRRPRPYYLAPLLLLLICLSLAFTIWWFNPGSPNPDSPSVANSANPSDAVIGSISASPTPVQDLGKKSQITSPASAKSNNETSLPSPTLIPSQTASAVEPTATASSTSTLTREAQPTSTPSEQTPTAVPPTSTQIIPTPWPEYRISAGSASLRHGPGTRFDVVGYLLENETVTIIGRNRNRNIWYVVRTADGRTGWISASVGEPVGKTNLEDIAEAATIPAPPPTPTPTPTETPIPTETPTSSDTGGNSGGSGGGGNDQDDKPKPKSTPTPPL
jgi:serine/threonine-protein kinase